MDHARRGSKSAGQRSGNTRRLHVCIRRQQRRSIRERDEEKRETTNSRREDNEQKVKRALPLCNKTLKMLGFLSTDTDIRGLFLLDELCSRLVNMLLHVLTKLVGAKGMELKVRILYLCGSLHYTYLREHETNQTLP